TPSRPIVAGLTVGPPFLTAPTGTMPGWGEKKGSISSPPPCRITPRSRARGGRSGARNQKTGGGENRGERLKRPWSSCRARGGVPYSIGVAPASGLRRARQSSHTTSLLIGACVQPYQVKQAVHRKVPVGAVGVSTDAARRGASVTLRASD